MKRSCIILFISVAFFASRAQVSRDQFNDLLSVSQTIRNPDSIENTFFSDMGAWHGYALPQRKEDYGSFIGPLLMDMKGQWLANTFAKLQLRDGHVLLDFSKAAVEQHYYPGMLEQTVKINHLEIVQRLIFAGKRTALIETRIINHSLKKVKLDVAFIGKIMGDYILHQEAGTIRVTNPKNPFQTTIAFDAHVNISITQDKKSYQAGLGTRTIKANEEIIFTQCQSYYLAGKDIVTAEFEFGKELAKNKNRWDEYINSYFSAAPALSEEKKRLAVKSIITLITNWRSAAKDLHHDGVFPSVNYQGFYGVWSWDSWKQAVGLTLFNPTLAKDNIRCMFDYMDNYDMVVDCIYADKSENNERDTKPPLAAWSVWNVFRQTKDSVFAKELYPQLVRYHEWWYKNRDHDKNGLCEYGSTDGTRIAAAWESGMDNAVRFDSAIMLKNNDHAWSLNQESVDLNSYLYAEKLYLSKLAGAVKLEDKEKWLEEAASLLGLINNQFYDADKGYYYDRLFGKEQLITLEGTEGWIPLWAGVANPHQAEAVMTMIKNEQKFNTKVPMPTFTADHIKFDPLDGYWRGPVWLDQFYFGIHGLNRYGYQSFASELTEKLFRNAEGLLSNQPICENYHPLTGQCLNAKNFSWSAAHILMLLSPDRVN